MPKKRFYISQFSGLTDKELIALRKVFLAELPIVAGLIAVSDPELSFQEAALGAVEIVDELFSQLEEEPTN